MLGLPLLLLPFEGHSLSAHIAFGNVMIADISRTPMFVAYLWSHTRQAVNVLAYMAVWGREQETNSDTLNSYPLHVQCDRGCNEH